MGSPVCEYLNMQRYNTNTSSKKLATEKFYNFVNDTQKIVVYDYEIEHKYDVKFYHCFAPSGM